MVMHTLIVVAFMTTVVKVNVIQLVAVAIQYIYHFKQVEVTRCMVLLTT